MCQIIIKVSGMYSESKSPRFRRFEQDILLVVQFQTEEEIIQVCKKLFNSLFGDRGQLSAFLPYLVHKSQE